MSGIILKWDGESRLPFPFAHRLALKSLNMSWTAGTEVSGYEIKRLLGAGGMGEVYLARNLRLQRDVALKVLPPSLIQDPERRARFEREARVLAALSHPNIAAIHGIE